MSTTQRERFGRRAVRRVGACVLLLAVLRTGDVVSGAPSDGAQSAGLRPGPPSANAPNDGRSLAAVIAYSGTDVADGDEVIAFRASAPAMGLRGELEARMVDPASGTPGSVPIWRAGQRLDDQVRPAGPAGGWDTGRRIATRRADTGAFVPFRWHRLSVPQQRALAADSATSMRVLAYLRGDRSGEAEEAGRQAFGRRVPLLGDHAGSEPCYVGAPTEPLDDAHHPGYAAFRASNAGRTPMVYLATDEGMLHAFRATTSGPDAGTELWAYRRGPSTAGVSETPDARGLRANAQGPRPIASMPRATASPVVGDVEFARADTERPDAPSWHTVLVAGPGRGATGYVAIDVTKPQADTEEQVAEKVLWEFHGEYLDDPRVGRISGDPLIIRTRRFGWVVVVASGFGNATGTGHLWLLDPRTGAVRHRFDTAGGNPARPAGLAHPNVYMRSAREATAEQLYAGDLNGTLWRFDVSGATADRWRSDGERVAEVGQPIVSPPAIALDASGRGQRWVLFGTAGAGSAADGHRSGPSAFFAIRDGDADLPAASRPVLRRRDLAIVGTTGQFAPVGDVPGWSMDMTAAGGGRILMAPLVARGVVIWSSDLAGGGAASAEGGAVLYARAIATGANRLTTATFARWPAAVTRIQMLRASALAGAARDSQGRYVVRVADASGADRVLDVHLAHPLGAGLVGIRYLSPR